MLLLSVLIGNYLKHNSRRGKGDSENYQDNLGKRDQLKRCSKLSTKKDPKCQRPPSFLGGHGEDGALSVKLENRQLKFEI